MAEYLSSLLFSSIARHSRCRLNDDGYGDTARRAARHIGHSMRCSFDLVCCEKSAAAKPVRREYEIAAYNRAFKSDSSRGYHVVTADVPICIVLARNPYT